MQEIGFERTTKLSINFAKNMKKKACSFGHKTWPKNKAHWTSFYCCHLKYCFDLLFKSNEHSSNWPISVHFFWNFFHTKYIVQSMLILKMWKCITSVPNNFCIDIFAKDLLVIYCWLKSIYKRKIEFRKSFCLYIKW